MHPLAARLPHERRVGFGSHSSWRLALAALVEPGRSIGQHPRAALWLGLALSAAAVVASVLSMARPADRDPTPLALAWLEEDGAGQVIPVGQRIVWTNVGQQPHTITARDGSFDSGVLGPGEAWARVFSTAGSYPVYCTLHPSRTSVVIVEERVPAGGFAAPGFDGLYEPRVPSP